jgi:signal transduction histidine kinase
MDGKGSLTVNTSLHPHYLILDVIDTGRGIPSDEIKEIFNPFFTANRGGQGSGSPRSI